MIDLYNLMDSGQAVRAYISSGDIREDCWFKGTPENIASFLLKNQDADRITITDPLDRLVLNSYGSMIDSCPDKELLRNVAHFLKPLQLGETDPVVVPTYRTKEMNHGYPDTENVACVYRYGDDDYSLWDVALPRSVFEQVKAESQIIRPDLETLLVEMPVEDMLIGDWLYIIERSGPNHSMFYAEVGSDFYEDFNYLGCSVRGSLADILTEIKTSETEIDIMWDDLKPEAQERIKQMLGDNGNYDMFPIATIYAPGHEQNMQMQ